MSKGQVVHWKRPRHASEKKDRHIKTLMCINILLAVILTSVYVSINKFDSTPWVSDIMFTFFYLLPLMFITVLYGLFPAMIAYIILYVTALFVAPHAAYIFTMHLTAILIINIVGAKGCFRSFKKLLFAMINTIVVYGVLFYLLYGLLTNHSLYELHPMGAVYCAVVLSPVVFIDYSIIYLFLKYVPENIVGLFPMGYFRRENRFLDDDEVCFWMPRSKWNLRGRLTAYFVLEAVCLAVGAACFANMLIPSMGDSRVVYDGLYMPIIDSIGRDMTFFESRDAVKFYIDPDIIKDLGLTFDMKLILYLYDILMPIITFFNLHAQRSITLPIQQMTVGMKLFSDRTLDNREELADQLAGLDINTHDELQQLHETLVSATQEITAHIDDIKREKRLEEDLRVAQAAAKNKTDFLSNMSHEIRTPINAVLGMDEMILREAKDKDILRYAMDIQNSGRTLLSLINDILDFSKLEAGKMELVPVQYELSSVLNDLINTAKQRLTDKDVELIVDINEYTPHILYGDEIRLKQVAMNILTNAVKYTPEGSVTLKLDFERCPNDAELAMLRFVISDTGIGMKEEDIEKLFSAFTRIDEERNRTIEGTGLGMSIVKNLLDLMDSKLEVHSVYGEGSTFSFRVKQKVISWEPIGDFTKTYEKSLENVPTYEESFHAPDARVLVVDDTPVNLTVVQGLLKNTAMQVDTAESGQQCIKMTEKKEYDVIFLDHRMPGMDGIETFHALKEDGENKNHRTPIIALTANAISGSREIYIKEGFADYLSKPINSKRMEEMLIKYLPRDKVIMPDDEGFESTGVEADATSSDDRLAALKQVDGIDYDEAIKNCMKEEILLSAAEDFLAAISSTYLNIDIANIAADWNNYTVLVHGLKSSARLIGAMDLSGKARELEALGDRAKSGDQKAIDEILEKTPVLLEEYKAFEEKLAFIDPDLAAGGDWSSAGESAVSEKHDDRPTIDRRSFEEALFGVGQFVEAFDFDGADDIIAQLRDFSLTREQSEDYNRFKLLVKNLDRDRILTEIEEYKKGN